MKKIKNIFKLIDLIKYPVISEKSMNLLELNQYSFIVDLYIKKTEIKLVIEHLFKVKIEKINILTCPLKMKKKKTKKGVKIGYYSKYKKAIIHLNKNDKIDFFANDVFEKRKIEL
jgi:large subunit ribosomal protein L23